MHCLVVYLLLISCVAEQEKDFIVDFTIEPLKISKPVSPTWNYVYNGKEIILDVPGYNEDTMIAKNNTGTNV